MFCYFCLTCMRKEVFFLMFTVLLLGIACSSPKKQNRDTVDKLMGYNQSFVGDASAVGNILTLLDVERERFALETDSCPYIIHVFCVAQKDSVKQSTLKEIYMGRSAVLFSLVKNVDEIKFSFPVGKEYVFTRDELDHLYGVTSGLSVDDHGEWIKKVLAGIPIV